MKELCCKNCPDCDCEEGDMFAAPNYGAAAVAAQMAGEPLEGSYHVSEPYVPANARQVGGDHYMNDGVQHWDLVHILCMDYYVGQATKYLCRAHRKNGAQDYAKAVHYIDKRRELGFPDFDVGETYNMGGKQQGLTHVLMWDFCHRQEMPIMAVRAFFSLLTGNTEDARTYAQKLSEQ